MDSLRRFFGFSNDDNSNKDFVIRERIDDDFEKLAFNMFGNSLDMHKYFQHQVGEIMKSFGMFGEHDSIFGDDLFFEGGGGGDQFFEDFNKFPTIEEFHKPQEDDFSLRDSFLKQGYETPKTNGNNKVDKDLDGQFALDELDSVLKRGQSQVVPRSFFKGKTMITKTVRDPDGTWVTHKTIKDHEGNEETSIIRAKGDQKYSIVTKMDKDGHREITEDLINLEEHEKDKFINKPKKLAIMEDKPDRLPSNWFPFDKFFK